MGGAPVWASALVLRRSRGLFSFLRAAFVVAALLPPLVPITDEFYVTEPIGTALRALYGLQCHQRATRNLVAELAFPVCARCLGIYFGMGLAGLVCRPRLRTGPLRTWLVVATVLLLLDVATERVHLRGESAWLRAATGALLAYGAALAMLGAVRPRRS